MIGKLPQKIVLVGDVHGDIERLNAIARDSPEALHIAIGDLGIGFCKDVVLAPNVAFYRGNHDMPQASRDHPNYLCDYGYFPGHPSIYVISGGESIDKAMRIEGVSWWPDEELDIPTFLKVIDEVVRLRPEVILSHECPSSIIKMISVSHHRLYPPSRTAQALQRIFELHRPKLWVFGHHHVHWYTTIRDTRFVCLAPCQTYAFTRQNTS